MEIVTEERKNRKKHTLRNVILFFLITGALFYGAVYMTRSTWMCRIIDSRNSEASTYMKAVTAFAEEYSKTNGKLPDDKEYIVKGQGHTVYPCELFADGGDFSNFSDDTKVYWAVKFKDGEPIESWTVHRPINDDEIVHFNRDDQVELYKSDIMHSNKNVIGHCCGIEPIKYFDIP